MWQFWVTFLIGLWLLLGQGLMSVSVSKENFEVLYLLTGIFSFTLGLWLFFGQLKGLLKVFSVVIGLAGIWLGITAFISGLQGIGNAIILGIILIVLGFWGALTKSTA
ncbi:hypothetical protein JGI1_01257 [Candidatus Thermokryptus mobilis]|uniref:Uncharacterized protein n=1 Tax=Candidatus Thermokryptus mobilis TaxID=1643428 RepID=A0A0S4N348_9BACT|nr:hypothetical protein [Candidatus Thermokryptus mobilis]CUU05445.1 hypothetical protein JGI1_01257 [Candidatus Thermokryptus mobilis]